MRTVWLHRFDGIGRGRSRWIIGERQVNVRVVPTGKAIEESVDLAYEIFNRVFRRVPERMPEDQG